MLIKKGNIYRNVSAQEFEKYKRQGYTEVKEKKPAKVKEKKPAEAGDNNGTDDDGSVKDS